MSVSAAAPFEPRYLARRAKCRMPLIIANAPMPVAANSNVFAVSIIFPSHCRRSLGF